MPETDIKTEFRYWGRAKALGGGRIRGPVVLFGDPKTTDLVHDFFTEKTDFGVAEQLPVYYQHGFDPVLKKRRLSVAPFSIERKSEEEEFGLWAEYQLDLADKYQAHLYAMAEHGKMGHSSGALAHLVEYEQMPNETWKITAWPLGELSLTPEPMEPRMVGTVVPAKSFQTESVFSESPSPSPRSSAGSERGTQQTRQGITIPVTVDIYAGALNPRSSAGSDHNVNQKPPTRGKRTAMLEHIKQLLARFELEPVIQAKATLQETITMLATDEAVADADPATAARLARAKSWTAPVVAPAPTPAPVPTPADPAITATLTAINALMQAQQTQLDEMQKAFQPPGRTVQGERNAPNLNLQTGLGDSEAKALAHWIRTGQFAHLPADYHQFDDSPESGWDQQATKAGGVSTMIALKASNDTSYAAGDLPGSTTIPTGHFAGIIARRDPGMISARLQVMPIPGLGTTVNVTCDNEDDGEFVATAERAQNDRDAADLVQRAMTLANYTKMVELTNQQRADDGSNLMAFLNNWIGRGMAKTHNSLLLTAVGNSGTSLKTFAGTNTIAAGEPEDVIQDDDLAAYLEDGGSVGWVMRNSTHWTIKSITGNDRLYDDQTSGSSGRVLLDYPVIVSNKAAALATGANVVYFGNWSFVGVRNDPEFRVLRDEFTGARNGLLRLHYYFRTIYRVLQPEAIGYGVTA